MPEMILICSKSTPAVPDRIYAIIPDANITPSLGSRERDAMEDSIALFSTFYNPVIQMIGPRNAFSRSEF